MNQDNTPIDFEKIENYWKEHADKDYKTMLNLFETGDYHWSLFIGHLVIERLLKAYYVKTNKRHAPFIHDLLRLAEISKLSVDEEKADLLDTITTFNLHARYDNFEQKFYNKCTEQFTLKWIEKIKGLCEWIRTKL